MQFRRCLTTVVALLLAGCAGNEPSQVQSLSAKLPEVISTDERAADLKAAIDAATQARDSYSAKAKTASKWNDFFNVPIIAAAAGAAGALLYRSSIDVISGIGLGAGTATAYKTYFNPSGDQTTYLTAAEQLDCAVVSAQPILKTNPEMLRVRRETLIETITAVRASAAQPAPPNSSTQITDAATKNLNDAISAAETGLSGVDAEFAAYTSAPTVLARITSQVKKDVDVGTERQPLSFAAARAAIASDIQTATQSSTDVRDAREKLIQTQASQTVLSTQTDAAVHGAPQIAGAAAGTAVAAARASVPVVTNATSDIAKLLAATDSALKSIPSPSYTSMLADMSSCRPTS